MLQHFISDSACTIDATTIFTGGKVMLWVLMSGSQHVLGEAVNEAAWLPGMSLLATSNEDYSLRQQAPVHSQQLQNGHYSLRVRYPWMAVGTTQPPQVHHTFETYGLDGAFRLSDKDSKQSLKFFLLVYMTCMDSSFNFRYEKGISKSCRYRFPIGCISPSV
ncbi:protein RAE1-like [Papaver somniferum]|uniref:protein RAE1-like n=1 Tax=Papaver somniferum TaxID=3469 RepID=UPI000E704B9D|nr:protein RAE1-like [Papaver somniferum]